MEAKQTYPVVVRTEIEHGVRPNWAISWSLKVTNWNARFWCSFRITRPKDNTLIAECRQMLAIVKMPAGKLLRLPEHWQKYRQTGSVKSRSIRIGPSREECVE
jgi:acyl-CoA thioesterase FadM